MSVKVHIAPSFRGEDKGDGGIRRVVEAQIKYLPRYGIEITGQDDADVYALHAGNWVETNKPIVAHTHGLYWEGYEWPRWAHALNKDVIRTMKQSDVITVPSNWVGDAVKRGMWRDCVTLYHGIDPDDWPEPDYANAGDYVLWNKTRVDAICDPKPVNALALKAPGVRFVSTYGDAARNVEITGSLSYQTAKRLVQNAGVYLCTARETFGIGTLEAMAAGVPILGWRWGGQAEIVHHKVTGYLSEPGDVDDLLRGLYYCIANRQELGENARRTVLEDYTWAERIKPYAELYKSLCVPRPTVSVVITNHNLGRYLPKAVESALQETKHTREVILIDDASTEPLPELPDGVQVHRNQNNLYLSEALNVGIGRARGRYIIPLDADNQLAPGAIDVLADALDTDRGLDVAYGKMQVVPENDPGRSFVSGWPPEHASLELQTIHRNQISSTAMYRRTVWERVGGYRRRCHTAEDADFWCRVLSTGGIGRRVTEAVTLIYLDRTDSMSHQQKDWAWHLWYQWATKPDTRLFAAGGENIPTHEFPLVSVIIPVGKGHERLVLDALDSVQAQTFRHWECLVINDTGGVLDVHPWAKVLGTSLTQLNPNEPAGAARARNLGIYAARGNYVLFLDADDWLHPDAIQSMYNVASVTPNVFVYSDWFVGETGEQKHIDDFDPDAILRQLPYPVTCMYARDDLLNKKILFDGNYKHGWEDWDFALQVIVKHGICGAHIKAPLFHYRLTTGTLREKAYSMRDVLKMHVLDKWGDYIKGEKENMARCGGCGGGGFRVTAERAPATNQAEPDEAYRTLEYTGDDNGTRSFVGRASGIRYRFGNDDTHRVRRVKEQDVTALLSLGFFRELEQDTQVDLAPLQASGPPA